MPPVRSQDRRWLVKVNLGGIGRLAHVTCGLTPYDHGLIARC